MKDRDHRLLARAYGRHIDRPGSMAGRYRISLFEDRVCVEEFEGGALLLSVPVERIISLGRYAQEAGGGKNPGRGQSGGGSHEGGGLFSALSSGLSIGEILGRIAFRGWKGKRSGMLQLQYWSEEGVHEGMFFGEVDFGVIERRFNRMKKRRRG